MPLISICIPAYDRPEEIKLTLNTLVGQEGDFDVVVSEDASSREAEIEAVVRSFAAAHSEICVHYFRNKKNLGYDANLRSLLAKASGEFCLFLADDDYLLPGAIAKVQAVIQEYDNVGVILRSWQAVDRRTGEVHQDYRYFSTDRFFPAGFPSVVTLFRRSVFISGYVVHRESARKYDTGRFDGTLLYQLYLSGNVLLERDGYYLADVLARMRMGAVHKFGNSEAEKDRFVPGVITPEHSLNFMRGMFNIAAHIEMSRGVPVYKPIMADIGNYAYPFLSIQAERVRSLTFLRYAWSLARSGLWNNPRFFAYVLALLVLRPRGCDAVIRFIKRRLGRTPQLGSFFCGHEIQHHPTPRP